MLEKISPIFDRITIIFVDDQNIGIDIRCRVRSRLIRILNCKDVSFITYEGPYKEYKQNIIYKKFIIDMLNDYENYITLFGHTLYVNSNEDINDIRTNIAYSYYITCNDINNTKEVLDDYSESKCLYMNILNNGFQWINTCKVNEYINNHNINIDRYLIDSGINIPYSTLSFMKYVLNDNHTINVEIDNDIISNNYNYFEYYDLCNNSSN
jgi:hypothetical protein